MNFIIIIHQPLPSFTKFEKFVLVCKQHNNPNDLINDLKNVPESEIVFMLNLSKLKYPDIINKHFYENYCRNYLEQTQCSLKLTKVENLFFRFFYKPSWKRFFILNAWDRLDTIETDHKSTLCHFIQVQDYRSINNVLHNQTSILGKQYPRINQQDSRGHTALDFCLHQQSAFEKPYNPFWFDQIGINNFDIINSIENLSKEKILEIEQDDVIRNGCNRIKTIFLLIQLGADCKKSYILNGFDMKITCAKAVFNTIEYFKLISASFNYLKEALIRLEDNFPYENEEQLLKPFSLSDEELVNSIKEKTSFVLGLKVTTHEQQKSIFQIRHYLSLIKNRV